MGRRHKSHYHVQRPETIIFPPDPNETGAQTVDRIYASFGLKDKFPKKVRDQVKNITSSDVTKDPKLKDLTDIPYITIDNDNSMDLDQAMYICRFEKGGQNGYRVSYALADGAFFVPPLSPLFNHALSKGGSSYYLPGKCIPMLPRELSENLMSLNANVKRRALVFDIYLDLKGEVIETDYTWAVIESRWKGTYREASEYYDAVDSGNPESCAQHGKEYTVTLDLLRTVGLLRRKLAAARDVVDYNRCGSGVAIDDKGNLALKDSTPYSSELYNEQISLLANSEGARLLADLDEEETKHNKQDIIHPIYRTQSSPHLDQVKTLGLVIKNTMDRHGFGGEEWHWDQKSMSIASYLTKIREKRDSLGSNHPEHQRWVAVVQVVERQAMITNVAASFTADPEEGHHSLKMQYYARFSSPMRELVGCFTHKELVEAQTGVFMSKDLSVQKDIRRTFLALRFRLVTLSPLLTRFITLF